MTWALTFDTILMSETSRGPAVIASKSSSSHQESNFHSKKDARSPQTRGYFSYGADPLEASADQKAQLKAYAEWAKDQASSSNKTWS